MHDVGNADAVAQDTRSLETQTRVGEHRVSQRYTLAELYLTTAADRSAYGGMCGVEMHRTYTTRDSDVLELSHTCKQQ